MNKTGWISTVWYKTRFKWNFKLFGLKFNIKITKRMQYSNNSQRGKNTIRALSTGEFGSIYGVKFFRGGIDEKI